jgi:hypothetical protein
MTTWEDTWKDITIEIPTLLPLGAVPQQPDPGEMLQYIQGLHNYIADDRQKLVRALNVLGRFRLLQTDDKTDDEIPASGSGAQKLNTVTGLMYYDDISQEANSGALWKPVAAARNVADFFNGSFTESFDAVVSSDGATITLSLEKDGTGDLTMRFSTGDVTLDCTPAQTIALTAGTDTVPVGNFVYIPRSTKVLTKSTSSWPSEEHIKVTYVFVRSAATTQTDGPLVNQNWNDHVKGTDGQGHMTHMAERSRRMGALWYDGVSPTYTAPGTTLDIALTAGSVYQMHKQTFPAFDTATGSHVHVANDSVAPYSSSTDPETLIQADSTGATLSNKYFNIVVFAVANKGDQNHSPVFINLPSGSYNNLSTAVNDTSGYDNFQIPSAFGHESSTGFLVSRLTFQWSGGLTNLTLHNTVDLRGYNPLTASGGSGSLAGALLQDGSTPLTGDWDTGATYGIDAAFLTSKGDVTIENGAAVNHRFYSAGDASLCLDSGDVHIGSGAGSGGFKVNISSGGDFIHCDSVDEYIEITLQSLQPIFSGYMHNDTGSKAPQLTGWRSGGTKASATATASGHALLKIGARPYDGTGWTTANKAQINISTVEATTATAQGTKIDFQTTDAGTTSLTGKMRIGSNDIEINRNNNDYDLIIDGDTTGNVIRMDAANHRVGINVSAPLAPMEINGDVRIYNGDAYICENAAGAAAEVMLMSASDIFNSGSMSYRTTINSVDVVRISATDGDPGASVMGVSEVAFYLDESGNNLMARVKYAGGTNKTGTVCALT